MPKIEMLVLFPPRAYWISGKLLIAGCEALMSYNGTEFKVSYGSVQIGNEFFSPKDPEWTPVMQEALDMFTPLAIESEEKLRKEILDKQKEKERLEMERRAGIAKLLS